MLKKINYSISSIFSINLSDNRIYGLDILRACAILFVVIGHGSALLPANSLLNKGLSFIIFDGVSIFFVLSGYLIGNILLKTLHQNTPSLKTLFVFWKRRWFRTIPTYFLILTFVIILAYCGKIYLLPQRVGRFYLFLQNINGPHPNFFNEAWSLSIEEWFYLLVPITLFILNGIVKIPVKTAVLFSAVSIILIITLFRYYRFSHFPVKSIYGWDTFFRKEVIMRFDSIMYGVLGAFFSYYYQPLFIRYKYLLFYTGLLLMLTDKLIFFNNKDIFQSTYQYVFSFSQVSLATLLLLPLLSEFKNGRGVVHQFLTYVSLISYSMYLINYSLILHFIYPLLMGQSGIVLGHPVSGYIGFILFVIITIILSALLYKYFEKPFTNMRDKA